MSFFSFLSGLQNLLYKYRDTMIEWRDQLQSDVELDEKTAPELLKASYVVEGERQLHKESLIATLCSTISVTDAIQLAHDEYEKENHVREENRVQTSNHLFFSEQTQVGRSLQWTIINVITQHNCHPPPTINP